jgi:hypothetical protein
MTEYAIIGQNKLQRVYLGEVDADSESDAVAGFKHITEDEKIKSYSRFLVFPVEDSAKFTSLEVRDMEEMD